MPEAATPTNTGIPLGEAARKLAAIPNNPLLDIDPESESDRVTDPRLVQAREQANRKLQKQAQDQATEREPLRVIKPEDQVGNSEDGVTAEDLRRAADAVNGYQGQMPPDPDDEPAVPMAQDPEESTVQESLGVEPPPVPQDPTSPQAQVLVMETEFSQLQARAQQLTALEQDTDYWNSLEKSDPGAWSVQRQNLRMEQGQIAHRVQQLGQQYQQVQGQAAYHQQAQAANAEGAKLIQMVPGWATTLPDGSIVPTKRAAKEATAMHLFLEAKGMTPQQIGRLNADQCRDAYTLWVEANKPHLPARRKAKRSLSNRPSNRYKVVASGAEATSNTVNNNMLPAQGRQRVVNWNDKRSTSVDEAAKRLMGVI